MIIAPKPAQLYVRHASLHYTASVAVTANRLYAVKVLISKRQRFQSLSINTGSTAVVGLAQIGLFDSDGTRLAVVTGLDTNATYTLRPGAIDVTLDPGQYYLAVAANAAAFLAQDDAPNGQLPDSSAIHGYAAAAYPIPATLPALTAGGNVVLATMSV